MQGNGEKERMERPSNMRWGGEGEFSDVIRLGEGGGGEEGEGMDGIQ